MASGPIAFECFIGWCLDNAQSPLSPRLWTLAALALVCKWSSEVVGKMIKDREKKLMNKYGPRFLMIAWQKYLMGPTLDMSTARVYPCHMDVRNKNTKYECGMWVPDQPVHTTMALLRIIIECASSEQLEIRCDGLGDTNYYVRTRKMRNGWFMGTAVNPWFPRPTLGPARKVKRGGKVFLKASAAVWVSTMYKYPDPMYKRQGALRVYAYMAPIVCSHGPDIQIYNQRAMYALYAMLKHHDRRSPATCNGYKMLMLSELADKRVQLCTRPSEKLRCLTRYHAHRLAYYTHCDKCKKCREAGSWVDNAIDNDDDTDVDFEDSDEEDYDG